MLFTNAVYQGTGRCNGRCNAGTTAGGVSGGVGIKCFIYCQKLPFPLKSMKKPVFYQFIGVLPTKKCCLLPQIPCSLMQFSAIWCSLVQFDTV